MLFRQLISLCVFYYLASTNKLLNFVYNVDVTEVQQHTLKYHSHDELQSALNESNIQAVNHYVILNESKDFSRDCKWSIRDRYLIFYSKKCLLLFFKWLNFTELSYFLSRSYN